MESFRQALGAIYIALAEAAGGDEVLERANDILTDAVKAGAVDDFYARSAIMALVRASSPDIAPIDVEHIEHALPSTPPLKRKLK
jgi:hypothetical protein